QSLRKMATTIKSIKVNYCPVNNLLGSSSADTTPMGFPVSSYHFFQFLPGIVGVLFLRRSRVAPLPGKLENPRKSFFSETRRLYWTSSYFLKSLQ
ncbi:hypothetical protein, partial [Geitlerinema sp. PCC 9228]|uniref:hypothetical protein n=1 Tax=Geitlerinema sp. PCC 9228 TaxID=111611 RepID=UPI001B8C346A